MIAKMETYADLTEDERDVAPNNGVGKEVANYLRITHNNKLFCLHSDAMEPEDARFCRDLDWVAKAIMAAYKLGIKGW